MTPAAYVEHDALALADRVARREVSPRELLDAARAVVDARNPELNAVIARLDARAEAAADALAPGASPLAGVPFLLKDLGTGIAGVPTSHGSALFREVPASATSTAVARADAAGLVTVGKTNTPEFGLSLTTEPRAFGATRNPWDRSRSPGGSSGGAAAAVASGMVPAAHASDGGGSIRCPAAACGLVGLKPTRGRVPLGPAAAEAWSGLGTSHAITRTVRDCAAILDATAGPEPGDPYAAPPPAEPYLDAVARPPERLRIALHTGDADAECRAAAEHVARRCDAHGHDVAEDAPAYDHARVHDAFLTLITAHTAALVDGLPDLLGRPVAAGELEPFTEALAARGRTVGAPAFIRARETLLDLGRRFGRFFRTYDLWLTPAMTAPPVQLGRLDPNAVDADTLLARSAAYAPLLPLANATGCPAINLPLARSDAGVPLGVTATAAFGREDVCLQLAAQLEAREPGFGCRPVPPS